MLPALLAKSAVKKLATSALGGIAKSIFGGKDDDEPKREISKNLFKSDEEKAEDKKKGVGGTLSKIRKSIFGGDSSSESGATSKGPVKRESRVVVDAVNNSNQILGDILSTLQQSLALQQSVVKPSRDELLQESQAAFKGKPKGIGSRIAASAKSTGSTLAKVAGIGLAGAAGIAGVQGFMGAEDTFNVDEATMSQKISSAIGNIIEKASFGLLKNEDIAVNIDSFFTTIRTKFNEGTKFLEETLGIKFGSDEGDGFFATIGRMISEGYTAFMESDAVKAIKNLFSGMFSGDMDKMKEASEKLSNMVTDIFQKLFETIFEAIGKITLPKDTPFIGGRSIGNLLGGKATSKLDIAKEELDTFDERNKGIFGTKKTMSATRFMLKKKMEAAEKGEDYQVSEKLQKAIDRENAYREKRGLPPLMPDKEVKPDSIPDKAKPDSIPDSSELEGTENQSYGDSVRAQAREARSIEFKREVNRRHENMEIALPDKATTTNVNNAMAVNTVRKDTVVSQTLRPRVNSSAYENFLEKNTSFA